MACPFDSRERIGYPASVDALEPMALRSCAERLDEASWHFLASLPAACPAALDAGLGVLGPDRPDPDR